MTDAQKEVQMYILATIIVLLFTLVFFWVNSFGLSLNIMPEFIDCPTFMVLMLLCLFFLMVTGTLKDFKNAIRFTVRRKSDSHTLGDLRDAQDSVIMLSQAVIYGSIFITAFCGVDILYHMDDLSSIGPLLAIMLLSIVYGMLIEMVLLIMKINLQKKIRNYLKADAGDSVSENDEELKNEGENSEG